jgi:hypothetical protein
MELAADSVRNRTNNLIPVAAMSIFGVIALVEATIGEPDLNDKVDDALFVLLALAGPVWYQRGGHRYERSLVPLSLLGLGIVNKLYTILGTEAGDPGARGFLPRPVRTIAGDPLLRRHARPRASA